MHTMSSLSPFVYWAQNENSLFLKIDLKDVKGPDIDIGNKHIHFIGIGRGAQGSEKYSFQLNFLETVDTSDKIIKVTDRCINITLHKKEPGWWPRLISTPQKPSWLKIDFDKWQSEDDLVDEAVNDIATDYPDVYKNLMKNELGYMKVEYKAVYLLFYNLGMLSAFLYAAVVLVITLAKNGFDESAYSKVYPATGHILCFIHLFQALEIMHPMFGYVTGSPLMPFIQIFGRIFILFGNLEFESQLQKMPVITWLFAVWICSDIIRYIYYIFHTADSSTPMRRAVYPFFKWLRYSAWIILYPIGFVCESVIIFRNILYLHNTPRFYLRMPNPYNITFDYLTFLRIYMLVLMFPSMYSLIKHMYKARVKNLGGREPFDKLSLFNFKKKA
ncbi:very-long-chain (3R)-3-hydroxyacyl-CoA dehydratase [Euwallacea fornicatus]|uniref:very-long-chain (3R)-3-hydroxyacyl-CoA dehydratase n=1 Tax=Euwallacea fornicatus TaxID=995702 RepID=UPI00338F4A89